MPLIVDHDERRLLIARVVKRLVAKDGMDAVTVRNVAREAGFSSTIVSHYFRDKQDLLAFTYGTIRSHAIEMIDEAFAHGADLLTCFALLLPCTPENLGDWQAWFAFWGKANADPGLAAERNAATAGTRTLFERIIARGQAQGELPADLDVKFHSDRLQIFINGLASFAVMQPEIWTPAVQQALLASEIDLMKARRSDDAGAAKQAPLKRARPSPKEQAQH